MGRWSHLAGNLAAVLADVEASLFRLDLNETSLEEAEVLAGVLLRAEVGVSEGRGWADLFASTMLASREPRLAALTPKF
jgi:hypothetical protein